MRDIRRRSFLGIGGSLVLASIAGAKPSGTGATKGEGTSERPTGLTQLGRYESGLYDEGGAEIPAYDAKHRRLFVVNAGAGVVDVLNVANPSTPTKLDEIDGSNAFEAAGDTNSVDVFNSVVAAAIANEDEQANGRVAFYDVASRTLLNVVEVGALPDMVTFTPDGRRVLVANEGEPTSDYATDPAGSISVVDLSDGVANATVETAGFEDFDAATLRAAGVRIYGPGATAAQDLEPEYVAVAPDGDTAYVTLQENNAIAVVDVANAEVTNVAPLGYKDHSLSANGFGESNALDAIDDGTVDIETQPVYGMYQPDSISAIDVGGETYLVTANEGDAREYDALFETGVLTSATNGFVLEVEDGDDVPVDETAFDAGVLASLEGLEVTAARGDTDDDGAIEELYLFGGRSFAVWRADGDDVELVYESGDRIEQILSDAVPEVFNTDDDSVELDAESAASGAEPEGLTTGYVDGVPVVFVALEEMGGILMFDVSDPTSPAFVEYVNNRIFDLTELGLAPDADLGDALKDGTIAPGAAGDLAPEGLLFIPAEDAPKKSPLLVVGNELSGTTAIYEVGALDA